MKKCQRKISGNGRKRENEIKERKELKEKWKREDGERQEEEEEKRKNKYKNRIKKLGEMAMKKKEQGVKEWFTVFKKKMKKWGMM